MLGWQEKTEGEGPWHREFIALCQVKMAYGIVIPQIPVPTKNFY